MSALYELARPRHFSEYYGQPAAVAALTSAFKKGEGWKGVLIAGGSGTGKTTLARILAVSVNAAKFGDYKPEEYDTLLAEIDRTEVNAADYRGVEAMRGFVRMADLLPNSGRKKVILLDEAHQLTGDAQNALLKPMEDGPGTTLWILCTTEPEKIKGTIKQRCVTIVLRPPDADAVDAIIKHAKQFMDDPPASTKRLRKFLKAGTYSGRQIVTALERYAAGGKLDARDNVEEIPSIEVCRALLRGDWYTIAGFLKGASAEGTRQLRMAVLGYLRAVALNPRTERGLMDAIFRVVNIMTILPPYEDPAYLAWYTVALYESCVLFKKAGRR